MSFLAALRVDAPEAAAVEQSPAVGGATVTKAVIDTNAIVKGFRLERFADEAVTIPEVLAEVKDKQARHVLATLPFELRVRDPDEDAVRAVRRFARLTGDLGALSEPDIKVIALAYMLERDAHGVAHLRAEPPPLVLSKHKHSKSTRQPGWDFLPNADDWAELDAMNEEAERTADAMAVHLERATLEADAVDEIAAAAAAAAVIAAAAANVVVLRPARRERGGVAETAADADDGGTWEKKVCRTTRIRRMKREDRREAAEAADRREAERAAANADAAAVLRISLDQSADHAAAFFTAAPEAVPEGAEEEDDDDEVEADGDRKDGGATGGGAETGSDGGGDGCGAGKVVDSKGEEVEGGSDEEGEEDVDEEVDWAAEEDEAEAFESSVVCITADYAMQNVILQMNMRLLTPDGMRITNLRRWVLRCHACAEVTRQTTRVFCPKCGNASLQKVEHTVTAEGVEQFGVRRKHILRGTRFSLPMPKGGRREKAPILREDQLIGMRGVRRKDEVDVFAAEYNEESFAGGGRGAVPGTAHLYQQRELLEVASGGNLKKNPNERRFVRTNRRRK